MVNDPENQLVYVDCVGGRHRTGVMTAVYRMTRDGWTADQAFKEIRRTSSGPISSIPSSNDLFTRTTPLPPSSQGPGSRPLTTRVTVAHLNC